MHYITLDTNTWIYLANGTEPARLLSYINSEVDNGNLTILLPEYIIQEWQNHKQKTVWNGSIKHFEEINKSLDTIQRLLSNEEKKDAISFLLAEEEEKPHLKDIIISFKKKQKQIEEAVINNISLIDTLFKSKSIIIPANEKVYVKCGKFALDKKAPFKFKNSFADALILFSLLDYIKEHSIENTLFISYNTSDFCEQKDGKKALHPDLIDEFKTADCKYYKTLSEALNTIKADIVSREELKLIRILQAESNEVDDIEFCHVCEENDEKLNEVYFRKPHELIDERNKYTEISVGRCDWCNSIHFKCVECRTVNAVWGGDYDVRKECEGCGLNYVITSSRDRDNVESIHYTIPKDTITCQKCGDEFGSDDMIENLCINCESEYSYGEK
jgi:predicted nucleic acid-binding protein